MLFHNNNSGSRSDVSVNTGIDTLWSDLSSLTIGCWNNKISLALMPENGKNDRGFTVYNKEKRIQTSLPHVKINALLNRYKKKIAPLFEGGEIPPDKGISVGVPLQSKEGTTIVMLEYKADKAGKPAMFLTIAQKLNANGVSENVISYQFNELMIMENYRPSEGVYDEVPEEAEFEYFMDILKAHVLMTGLNSHATRYSDAFKKNSSSGALNADVMNMPDAYGGGDGLPFQ